MHLSHTTLRFGVVVALICSALPASVRAMDDPILVRLVDGKQVTATIDRRTDQDRLWLTTSLDGGSLCQAIPWQEVNQIEIGGQNFTGAVVRAAVTTILQTTPGRAQAMPPLAARIDSEALETGTWQQASPPVPPTRSASRPKVQAMSVSAWLANWDQDVAVDGLLVELTPRDAWGNPISCDGTANFLLQAWKTSGRDRHLEIRPERWTQSVRAGEFAAGSVVFRLPFRTIQPQRNSDWWPHGVLLIRLTVPGAGVVERTLSDLRLRCAEPMRDTWEQYTGHRYFPGENTRRHAWAGF